MSGITEFQMSGRAFLGVGVIEPGEILVFRQDLQDYQDYFFILSHFPDGSEKTQSAWRRKLIAESIRL